MRAMKLSIVVAVLSLVACGKKDAGSPTAGSAAASGSSAAAPVAAPVSAPAPPASGAAGDTGIPECDDYLAKLSACYPKMEPDVADKLKKQTELQAAGWKAAKGSPAIADNCKANLDAMKAQFAKLGCAF